MVKQSSSRTHKSKGVKVKHVLQICVLLAVCFWLIYQVKHSHDKRKEFDEKALAKLGEDRLKLGRKDLLPQEDDEEEQKLVGGGERHVEEEVEEEEDKHQIEEEEEDKHQIEEEEKTHDIEEEEQEQEVENTNEVKNNAERGDGDDELDELGQVKTDGQVDQEEDILEEEKEGEEKADQTENESLLEEIQERDDGNDRNTHEAREEHYKADDASSEVTHDTSAIKDVPDSAASVYEHKSNETHEINIRNNTDPSPVMDHITSSNTTAGEEQGNNAAKFQPIKLSSNLTETVTEKSSEHMQNQNSSERVRNSIEAQNVKIEEMKNKQRIFIEELSANQTSEANAGSENGGTIQHENSGSSEETLKTHDDESKLYSDTTNETVDGDDSVQQEQIDSSDSDLQEEHANRIDLDTLPDIKTEGLDNEDAVAAE